MYVEDGTPIVVGIVATIGNGRNIISKVRTVYARSDFAKQITDDTILYLGKNKKETKQWFQALGQPVPSGGTKFGFIRSITLSFGDVKDDSSQNSERLNERKSIDIDVFAGDDKVVKEMTLLTERANAIGSRVVANIRKIPN